jgi:hypothetical protein
MKSGRVVTAPAREARSAPADPIPAENALPVLT